MSDGRNNLCREVERQTREVFGDEVFQTEIPRNIRLGEAPSFGKPVHAYDPLCRGAVSYTNLALELVDRMAREESKPEADAQPSTPFLRTVEAS